MKNNKLFVGFICLFIFLGILVGCGKKEEKKEEQPEENKIVDDKSLGYNERIIRLVNSKEKGNYLISPYSIEIALNMLKDGAKGESKEQIEQVIGTREIPVFNAKDRISVVNGAFIKEEYKDYVEKSYYDRLATYDAELIFDKFTSPEKINNWVKEHTYGMIPKILDSIDPEFVLGIANAVAIDVKWDLPWSCNDTYSRKFTKSDGSNMNVEMMSNEYHYGSKYYFETDGAKGVVLPYNKYDEAGEIVDEEDKDGLQLEYVAILPNGTVDEFISNLKSNQLKEIGNTIDSSQKFELNVELPRYAYDYELETFKDILIEMGIKDVFDEDNADLTGIISKENIKKLAANSENLYVSDAIHKTHIDLNEKGTKAAAVTYFGANYSATAEEEKPVIKNIVFDKPFIYMIRETKTKEILFFGVVEKPNAWKGSTCSNKEE